MVSHRLMEKIRLGQMLMNITMITHMSLFQTVDLHIWDKVLQTITNSNLELTGCRSNVQIDLREFTKE